MASPSTPISDIDSWADIGLRHKSGVTPHQRLEKLLDIARVFGGFATMDDSWGEFEKLFGSMVTRLVRTERELEKLREHPFLALPLDGRCEWCGMDNLTQADVFVCETPGCKEGQFLKAPDG